LPSKALTITYGIRASFATIYVDDPTVTLTDTGTIMLKGDGDAEFNIVKGTTSTNSLINYIGHTIEGSGHLGNGELALTNRETITATPN